MKDTLEYKILSYLSKNGKYSFVSLDDFIEDKDILRLKLKSLIKDSLIDIKRIRTGEYSTKAEYMINSNGSIYLNTLENNRNKNISNNFNNSTIGVINQESDLKDLNIKIKQTNQPTPKEIKQNPIISFLLKCWWQILIPLAIVIIGILIEKGVINIGI